ncbi:MAG: hypothetical protein A2Z20_06880 [Bdellovibrionales bacterium RBG_16_40_8]|nr:MAG: hypothetical protein A2Z20_06880 [Bdellovibrionales bacterium RBG_16_40_8]
MSRYPKQILLLIGFVLLFAPNSYGRESCSINVAVQSLMPIKDPLKAISWWAKRESTLQFDSLVRFTDAGEVQPWLARKWQFSKDLKTLTIDLRSGVKFTDGTLVDSPAVIKSLKRFVGKGSTDHGRLSYVKDIVALDQSKIQIKLSNPFVPLLYYLATPRSGIAKIGKNSEMIGSGPWIFEKSEMKNSIKAQVWKANLNYFNGAPFCRKLGLVEVPMNQLSASFKNKLIDLIEYYPITNQDQKDLVQSFGSDVEVREFPSYDVTALFFTEAKKSSVEKSSRQALSKIILKEFKAPGQNAGYTKVCSILPYGLAASKISKCEIEAIQLPENKRRTFLVYTQDDERSAILKKIAAITERHKYFLDFKFTSLSDLYSEHAKGSVGIHVETLTMQIPEPYGVLSMFESGSGENFSKYSNSTFDRLLSKAKAESDLNKRREFYSLAENLLLEDAIVIPLIHQSRVSIFSKGLTGYNSNLMGPFYAAYDKIIKKESE